MSSVSRSKNSSWFLQRSLNKRQKGNLGLFGPLFTVVLIGAAAWVIYNRQAIVDQLRILSFRPSSAVLQLAADDTLVGRGRDLYLASEPEIDDQTTFNNNCTIGGEKTIVLGCYSAQRIYIYNVTDSRLAGIKEVTAAHEMLHAAYERLAGDTKQQVNKLLNQELVKLGNDVHLAELIKLYNKEEPGQLLNEMHSVLGTEYSNLSPALEAYYKQYFSDRSKVATYAAAYTKVFTDSQNKIVAMDSKLATLKAQIDANDTSLSSQQAELNAERAQLTALARAGNVVAYNSQVPIYNQKVSSYNQLVTQTKSLIEQYNQLVDERNQEAAAQNNLYKSIDSHYQQTPSN